MGKPGNQGQQDVESGDPSGDYTNIHCTYNL